MATNIPENDLRFSQLAVKQGWILPDQARTIMELYLRFQARGGEVPSIGRILVNKGFIGRKQGEQILRHIYKGEPLPAPTPPPPNVTQSLTIKQETAAVPRPRTDGIPVPATRLANVSPFDLPQAHQAGGDENRPASGLPVFSTKTTVKLSSSGSGAPAFIDPKIHGAHMPPQPKPASNKPVRDTESAILAGLGALVLSKELQELKGYKIASVVGEGSMGIVYKAMQLSMEREVALKVLPPERTQDSKFVEEFLAEARNAGRLNHPNLIRVHEVGRSGKLFYYSMEFIEGMRLDELMDECEGGRLDSKQAVNIFTQVASALEYGQRAGIIHREIRPNAVMVSSDGHAKLSDLGMTKDEASRFLIGENAYYVSPEQAQGTPADTRSDIYSLGCCMYHALTGERPFEGGAPKVVLAKRLHEPTPNPRLENPHLPKELCQLVMKMMQRNPQQRYQTPGEVVDDFKKIGVYSPIPTPGKTKGGSRRRFSR